MPQQWTSCPSVYVAQQKHLHLQDTCIVVCMGSAVRALAGSMSQYGKDLGGVLYRKIDGCVKSTAG